MGKHVMVVFAGHSDPVWDQLLKSPALDTQVEAAAQRILRSAQAGAPNGYYRDGLVVRAPTRGSRRSRRAVIATRNGLLNESRHGTLNRAMRS